MDKETKKGLLILLLITVIALTLWGLDSWQKRKNKFVYEKNLDAVVLSVNGRDVLLRELSYYVYDVEMKVNKQAKIYNPEDPLDYWNTHFSAGLESAYISEMAKEAAVEGCVCDLVYEKMAIENGYALTEEEKDKTLLKAEDFYKKMSEDQKKKTGLTQDIIIETQQRKALVTKFAADYFEKVDFSGYSGYREELVSYNGDYYLEKVLPLQTVKYESDVLDEIKMGRVTTGL